VSSDHLNSAIFRAALIVMMLMGLPLIGVLIYLNLQQVNQEPTAVEVAPAEPVQ
jgi:hypothetical protein